MIEDDDQGFTLLLARQVLAEEPFGALLPSADERQNVPMGSHAKLIFTSGHIRVASWVKVVGREEGGGYHGKLEARLGLPILNMQRGDRVDFMPAHIINILKEHE